MKLIVLILITLASVTLIADSTEYFAGEIIVQIKGDYRQSEVIQNRIEGLTRDFSTFTLTAERELSRRMRIWLFTFDSSSISTKDFLALSKEHPMVEVAQYNHKVELRQTIPDDPQFEAQWALLNVGQSGGSPGADIDATLAWDITTGGITADGREIVIAIVDNGFDLNHPDIDYWKNIHETPGNGLDDDDNGYIDDYDGWNAYNNSGSIPSASHGTHVAGIVAAIGNNSLGVSGVNWGAKIMPIAGSSSSEAIVIAAYGYILEMRTLYNETDGQYGAYIVATNASFGVNYGQPQNYPLWGAMYDSMGEQGILSAAATMNINANVDNVGDVPTAFPSPYLLSVTNTTRTDQKNTGAAYGVNTIDLGAPGTQIMSTIPGGGYSNMTGTSMASPHVAGAVALMYAAAPIDLLDFYANQPENLALLFKDILIESVDIIPALENITVSGGRLNLNNALQMVLNHGVQPEEPAPYNLTAEFVDNSVVLNWEEHDYRNPIYHVIMRNNEVISTNIHYNLSFTDHTVFRGYHYEYSVLAGYENPEGESTPSNTAVITLPPQAPLLISPENGAMISNADIILEWEEVYGKDFFTLSVAYDPDFDTPFIPAVNLQQNSLPLPEIATGTTLYWRVSASNSGGTSEYHQTFYFTAEQDSDIDDSVVNMKTGLSVIYPNPFSPDSDARNGGLQINYSLGKQSVTTIRIFNVRGQLVSELVNSSMEQGEHTTIWNGFTDTGKPASNGLYFIRFSSLYHQDVGKVLLIR